MPTKTLSIALQLDQGNVRAGLGQSAADLTKFDKQLGQIGTTAGKGFGEATSHVANFRAGLGQTAQDLGKIGDRITIGVAVPLVAAGTAAVKMSNDFDTSFAHMVGLAGVPAAEVENLKKQVLDLSGTTAQAPVELANALYFVESAGIHGSAAMDTLTVSAKASQAGMGEASTVADALTSVISAYGAANITAAQAGDALAVAVRDGKAEASAFAPELGRLLPMATQLKIPFDQVAGSLSYLTRTSGDTALSATQLSGILNALLAPSSQAADEMQQLGVSTETVHQSLQQNGLPATLQMLRDKLGDNSDAMHQLFPDVRALNGVLGLTGDQAAGVAQVMDDMAHKTGAVDDAQKAVAGTAANQLHQAITDVQVDLVKMGDTIAPFVAKFAGGMSELVDQFASLPGPVQAVVFSLAGLVAAGGLALSVIGRVASGVEAAQRALSFLKAARAAGELGSLTTGLGVAGIAGAAVLAVSSIHAFVDSLSEPIVKAEDLDKALRQASNTTAEWLDNLAAFDTMTGGGMFGQIHSFDDAIQGLVDKGPAGIGVLKAYRDHLAATGQDHSKLDQILNDAASSQGNLNAHVDAGNVILGTAAPKIAEITTTYENLLAVQGGLVDINSQLAQGMGKAYDAMLAPQHLADQYMQSTNDLIDSLHKEGFSLDTASDASGRYNDHALKNIAAAQGLGSSISDLIQHRYEETGSVDAAVQSGIVYVQNLHDQLKAAGFTEDQVQQLIETMGLTPDQIRTVFSSNAVEQQLAIIKYTQTLGALPTGLRTEIEADLKSGDIASAEQKLNDFIDKKRTVHVGVDYVNIGGNVPQRWGGIVHAYAGGGLEAHVARDTIIRYAEPETGGEAFVPRLGDRSRSLGVLRVAAGWYNAKVTPFALGGVATSDAIGAAQGHAGALASAHDALAGSGTGALVAAEASMANSDPAQAAAETSRQLDQLAAAYVNVAEVAGQSAADQLAASNLTAAEFTDAASRIVQGAHDEAAAEKQAAADAKAAAEETARAHMTAHDVMFRTGNMDTASYLAILQKRLSATVQFSAEYEQIWNQINQINSDIARQHEAIHDVMYRTGKLGTDEYLAMLEQRLAKTEEFSPEWERLWNEIAQVQTDAAKKAEDAQKKLVDDTTTTAQEFNDALSKMTRPLADAFNANLGFLDQLQRAVDQVHGAGGSTNVMTAEGRADLEAIASAVNAAEQNAMSSYAKTGDLTGATQLLQQNLDSIKASLEQQGVANIDGIFKQLGVDDSNVASLLQLPHGGAGGTVVQGNQNNVNTVINVDMTGATVDRGVYEQLRKEFPGLIERSIRNVARA